jgi:lambda repressor-like predicted transcriptional regulator
MLASPSTELRGYENPYVLRQWQAMTLQDLRRENFDAWMKASGLNMNQVAEHSGVQYNTIRSYMVETNGKRTASLTGVNEAKIAAAYRLTVEDIFGGPDPEEGERNNIRAWREFRFLTVDELAARVEVPPATIELLEEQPGPPSDKWLRRLAPPLQTRPGFLREFNPNEVDTGALEAVLAKPSTKIAPAPTWSGVKSGTGG